MKKMVKQFSLAILIFGILMLAFALLLLVGIGGEKVQVSGFYFTISFLFIVIGIIGLRNHKRF